ncbi:hypothetical protein P7L74_00475 (plasmid) [Tistrella mobilis]|uniref:hypothetical protein n=1 Tax=Tistrella mobilis TaxID=171437 RepID=UPI003557A36D
MHMIAQATCDDGRQSSAEIGRIYAAAVTWKQIMPGIVIAGAISIPRPRQKVQERTA